HTLTLFLTDALPIYHKRKKKADLLMKSGQLIITAYQLVLSISAQLDNIYPTESSPIIFTSRSRFTPNLAFTVSCTNRIKLIYSVADALSRLIIKPACFNDTCAPPICFPCSSLS